MTRDERLITLIVAFFQGAVNTAIEEGVEMDQFDAILRRRDLPNHLMDMLKEQGV